MNFTNDAIRVEKLFKLYRLGEIGTGTISKDIERWFRMNVLGQDDPFMKIGQSNYKRSNSGSDIVYSLKDLNFEVKQGDSVGIIGKNGAGKSTLLKILSRVTSPSAGQIRIKGRVASLLEVGTGFHPELTGRENIFLNGAILGMRSKEIESKLDEIIHFSGVERYIDTPVKRYSSGMYVRLAFAVAAHLESEILIVDEVLAVGDAEFQKKCLGKMDEVSKSEGRTILFVSHNMDSIASLCNTALVLNDGQIVYKGLTEQAVNYYKDIVNKAETADPVIGKTNKIKIEFIEVLSINKQITINYHDPIIFRAEVTNNTAEKINFICGIQFFDNNDNSILHLRINREIMIDSNNRITIRLELVNQFLKGMYSVGFVLVDSTTQEIITFYNVKDAFVSVSKTDVFSHLEVVGNKSKFKPEFVEFSVNNS
jgi:ABC-type polysaccharide/polyol phosphate transport system ATPase subunit